MSYINTSYGAVQRILKLYYIYFGRISTSKTFMNRTQTGEENKKYSERANVQNRFCNKSAIHISDKWLKLIIGFNLLTEADPWCYKFQPNLWAAHSWVANGEAIAWELQDVHLATLRSSWMRKCRNEADRTPKLNEISLSNS